MQLLIADLHLHPAQPDIARAFVDYLRGPARDASSLTILGDLFEAWIGDDYQGEFERTIIAELRACHEAGTRLAFMHGNRDFLIGEGFAADSGCALLEDPTVVELGGERVLLMHGDSLCTRDEAYMAFRQQARNPAWQAQILAMPVEERLALAKKLRQQSGEANSNKAEDIMDVTPSEVVKTMEAAGVQTLIHGHTHRPAVHDLEVAGAPAKRYVLGDWRPDQGWQLRVEGDTFALESFSL
ncbi:UDP-2,3-diacylglucosamine diphosphatase [Salinicola rhizosphaerae]|uniref:UDP-2,3-diacylglucosamine hydrolase n=1 Tax=Salinicola rhizosphaerae TaxID=1443141 RepID=A0ABQ3DPD6_9GAMM|nr:UDP-2,3-diacylglucosamine diphosphatase [Salinicola rhizosphaerae]GHB10467.1 UDP-2,3-diacylglucosamine hydrolase [Salinicola rhizosphaerae]